LEVAELIFESLVDLFPEKISQRKTKFNKKIHPPQKRKDI
jgi:hypothetical protein